MMNPSVTPSCVCVLVCVSECSELIINQFRGKSVVVFLIQVSCANLQEFSLHFLQSLGAALKTENIIMIVLSMLWI